MEIYNIFVQFFRNIPLYKFLFENDMAIIVINYLWPIILWENKVLKIQGSNEEKEIREILKREKDDGIISVELTKIEQSLNGFKLLLNSMIKYKNDKQNKNITLKDFFGRLLKSFNNKDTALAILNNITGLEYENALFSDMPWLFDYIINNLLKK